MNQVTISEKEYINLQYCQAWKECCEAAGIDNWVDFEDAMEMLEND